MLIAVSAVWEVSCSAAMGALELSMQIASTSLKSPRRSGSAMSAIYKPAEFVKRTEFGLTRMLSVDPRMVRKAATVFSTWYAQFRFVYLMAVI